MIKASSGVDHRSGHRGVSVGLQADRLGAPHPSAARPVRSTQRSARQRDRAALGCGAPSGRDNDRGPHDLAALMPTQWSETSRARVPHSGTGGPRESKRPTLAERDTWAGENVPTHSELNTCQPGMLLPFRQLHYRHNRIIAGNMMVVKNDLILSDQLTVKHPVFIGAV